MRPTRGLSCFALAVLLAVGPLAPRATAADDAAAFMTSLGKRVISIINDTQRPETVRRQAFRTVVDKAFDLPAIARWVLGGFWRTASRAEQHQFVTAFHNYMVQAYWSRFSSHKGERFRVLGEKSQDNGSVLVTSELRRPGSGQAPVKVSWLLEPHGGTFKIWDASVEGVSQAETYRDEFADIIERGGGRVSVLIKKLNGRSGARAIPAMTVAGRSQR